MEKTKINLETLADLKKIVGFTVVAVKYQPEGLQTKKGWSLILQKLDATEDDEDCEDILQAVGDDGIEHWSFAGR